MPNILKIDEMLEAAYDLQLPSYNAHVLAIECAANALAKDLAKKLDVIVGDASWEGLAFAGTCAPFYKNPNIADQKCPDALEEHDPGGDWEVKRTGDDD